MLRLSPSSQIRPSGERRGLFPRKGEAHASRTPGRRKSGGFTLVEAIVATVVFSMVMLGVYGCIIKAYQLSQITRYNDQARAILLSYVDQFERLDTVTVTGSNVRPFFTPAPSTGVGVNWPALSNDDATSGQAAYTVIGLGDGTVSAHVTRAVYPLDASTGSLLATTTARSTYLKSPGYALMGIFTISYTLPSSGKTYSQRLSAVRAVP